MSEHDPPESAVEAGTVPLPRSGGYNSETARRVLTAAHEAGEIVWPEEHHEALEGLAVRMRAELAAEKDRADEAVALMREIERAFTGMPDAGLKEGDPRREWYFRTHPLRQKARAFLAHPDDLLAVMVEAGVMEEVGWSNGVDVRPGPVDGWYFVYRRTEGTEKP